MGFPHVSQDGLDGRRQIVGAVRTPVELAGPLARGIAIAHDGTTPAPVRQLVDRTPQRKPVVMHGYRYLRGTSAHFFQHADGFFNGGVHVRFTDPGNAK